MENHEQANFSLLSSLFAYPATPWLDIEELQQVINAPEYLPVRAEVQAFLDYVAQYTVEQLAEQYVVTFDFSEQSNLDVTSLLCPDDRKRGPVLAQLKSIYQQAGLDVDTSELPDYLPLVLEFLSIADLQSATEVLAIVRPGMEKLWEALQNSGSIYEGLLKVCLSSTAAMTCPAVTTEGGLS